MKIEKLRILELARTKGQIRTEDVANYFIISRQSAHKYLQELVLDGELVKIGKTRGVLYVLPGDAFIGEKGISLKLKRKGLKEHEVLEDVFQKLPALRRQSDTVQSIFRYAFSEMLNNAIDHSKSDRIEVRVYILAGSLIFNIRDFGVGVFRNIQKKYKLASEKDAIAELLKGKTTTAPKAHSGEGIFFTSKISDAFALESFGYQLLVSNIIPDVFVRFKDKEKKGTFVQFMISTKTTKHLMDVFQEYTSSNETHAFDKTKIYVKLYLHGTVHVSRSQARRILSQLPERFRHVVLDFDKVPTVGQAFVDEVFRVFKNRHPDMKIEIENANEAVQFMIDRVFTS